MQKPNGLLSLKPSLIEKIPLINGQESFHQKNSKDIIGSCSRNDTTNQVKSFNFWIEAYGCSANFSDM